MVVSIVVSIVAVVGGVVVVGVVMLFPTVDDSLFNQVVP